MRQSHCTGCQGNHHRSTAAVRGASGAGQDGTQAVRASPTSPVHLTWRAQARPHGPSQASTPSGVAAGSWVAHAMRGVGAGRWGSWWWLIQEQSCALAPSPPPSVNAVRGGGTGTRAVRWVQVSVPLPRVLWWTGGAITMVGPQVCEDLVSVATAEDHTRIGGSTEDAR
eukprot:432723-Rhodomonas_salina.1